MEWLNAMNRAIDHLEANMTQKLDIEEVAKLAFSSPFHFQRMYHMLTGVTVAEYVRRRRLTLAAQEIISGERVLDVALKYGYETPEAFAKAFRKMHGMSPSAAREPGTNLKAFPKLSFHISVKGDKDMDYKLIEKDSFKVIGKTKRITTQDGENLNLVPLFWNECVADGSYQRICSMAGAKGVFGICMDYEPNYEAFTYMIAVEDNGETPAEFSSTEIPAARWAVFESIGPMPGAIQKVWERMSGFLQRDISKKRDHNWRFIPWVIYRLWITSVKFGFLSKSKVRQGDGSSVSDKRPLSALVWWRD